MTSYNKINNAVGWLVFIFSFLVYFLTCEPTGSFWDCGEFIGCALKLQVAHSPGAPFFLMLARLFTMFASGPDHVALCVNVMNNLMGAFTSLFLFWTITAMARKMTAKKVGDMSLDQIIAVIGAGFVGAMACTFTDSNWFSAVEGEVYASSAFFTSLVTWAIFKWDNVADEKYADRWIVFIGYMMGLSIGIHLLNLLTIPALVFVVYFRKANQINNWGILRTFLIACGILAFIQFGIIPSIPNIGAKFDILFVNSLGLPFNTGIIVWFLIIAAILVFAYRYSVQNFMPWLHTSIMTVIVIIIGYSSYTMVLIRANANPTINMSNPSNFVNLVSYLNREQYGDRPLLYGQNFTARPNDIDWDNGEMKYFKGEKKYEELGRKPIVKYAGEDKMFFPRIFDNDDPGHVRFYREWLNLGEKEKPTFAHNIGFFLTYQVSYMYWRYFLWNFAGRQNDLQGLTNDKQHGNFLTGISFIDNAFLGPQENLPDYLANNKARNKFFLIPLIIGLIGMFYHFKKDKHDASVVMLLFFFTGLAIVLYLNQTPLQPRERDYAYAGSFYAYCFWIGIGVMAVYEWLKKKVNPQMAALGGIIICASAPALMGAQGWDDHNRSNRYTARDFGINYLESCPKNAILFTQGDNDTYPLWYAQEVEGCRPDVRIVNLSLLGVDWYIENLRRKVNESDAIPLTVPSMAVRGSNHDITRFSQNPAINQNKFYNAKDVIDFMVSTDPKKKTMIYNELDNYIPTKNLYIPVDKQYILTNGIVEAKDSVSIPGRLEWKLNKSSLMKPDLMVLDIIASTNWTRPVCFTVSSSSDNYLGLADYMQQYGLIYRLVPVKKTRSDGLPGIVRSDIMYDNIMHKFQWGGVDKNDVYLDENILRMVSNLRSNFARLATQLIAEGDTAKSIEVLDYCEKVLPEKNVPNSMLMVSIAEAYCEAGVPDKGRVIGEKLFQIYFKNLRYFKSCGQDNMSYYQRDINEAIYVIFQLQKMARTFKMDELRKQIDPVLEEYQGFYKDNKDNNEE